MTVLLYIRPLIQCHDIHVHQQAFYAFSKAFEKNKRQLVYSGFLVDSMYTVHGQEQQKRRDAECFKDDLKGPPQDSGSDLQHTQGLAGTTGTAVSPFK